MNLKQVICLIGFCVCIAIPWYLQYSSCSESPIEIVAQQDDDGIVTLDIDLGCGWAVYGPTQPAEPGKPMPLVVGDPATGEALPVITSREPIIGKVFDFETHTFEGSFSIELPVSPQGEFVIVLGLLCHETKGCQLFQRAVPIQ